MLQQPTELPPTPEELLSMQKVVEDTTGKLAWGQLVNQTEIALTAENALTLWNNSQKGAPDICIDFAVNLGNFEFFRPGEISITPDPKLVDELVELQSRTIPVLTGRLGDIDTTDCSGGQRSKRKITLDQNMAKHKILVTDEFLGQLIRRAMQVPFESV